MTILILGKVITTAIVMLLLAIFIAMQLDGTAPNRLFLTFMYILFLLSLMTIVISPLVYMWMP